MAVVVPIPRLGTSVLLDSARLSKYWWFVNERQRIWYLRYVAKVPYPWTLDDTLRDFSFTNMYRQLDPGTAFTVNEILDQPNFPLLDRMWNSIIYRVIGREATYRRWMEENGGFPLYENWNAARFTRFLVGMAESGLSPFSIAYLTTSFGQFKRPEDRPDIEKLYLAPRAIDDWHRRFVNFYNTAAGCESAEECYRTLLTMPSIGNFYAYQITTDWSYPLPRRNENNLLNLPTASFKDWVKAGPGAQDGICCLMGVQGKPNSMQKTHAKNVENEVIHYLYDHQIQELEDKDFAWLHPGFTLSHPGAGSQPIIPLSISDIQNTLCEFSKYMKVSGDYGKCRRRFVPPPVRDNRWYELNKGMSKERFSNLEKAGITK